MLYFYTFNWVQKSGIHFLFPPSPCVVPEVFKLTFLEGIGYFAKYMRPAVTHFSASLFAFCGKFDFYDRE